MALKEIRDRLGHSLEKLRTATGVYETQLRVFKNEIAHALFDGNIPDSLVLEIEDKLQKVIDSSDTSAKLYKTILEELSRILNPRRLEKIVMFIGLQGIGKSYTCARYARYQKKMGFQSAIVCGDTFASDACEFLKKAVGTKNVPVYKSGTTDPVKLATEGIANLKKLNSDFIVVDTSGKNTEFSTLFVEMQELANTLKPDLVIFVIDGSIGQAAFEQARSFRESFPAGLAFVTQITTNAKSLGALAAVAAAQCPIIFSTEGAKFEEFKELEPNSFASLLMPNKREETPEFAYTFRRMHSYFTKVCGDERQVSRGPKPLVDIPTMKLCIKIMNSMTNEELDTSRVSYERLVQISTQSGVTMVQARSMISTYKTMATAWSKLEDVLRKV